MTLLLLILSKMINVLHPLILKFAIDGIACTDTELNKCNTGQTWVLVAMYPIVRFLADFINNIREIPFANVSASSEIYIAHKVYSHITNQSLAFHLSRETGKVIRIVSRGSQSFSSILRYALFNLLPMIIEVVFVEIIIITFCPIAFFFITLGSVALYVIGTGVLRNGGPNTLKVWL